MKKSLEEQIYSRWDARKKKHKLRQVIAKDLGIKASTVSYYLAKRKFPERKNNWLQKEKLKLGKHASLASKIRGFCLGPKDFTLQDVIEKFGENPVCYLTGVPIDYEDSRSYVLDHIVPKCQGGSNSLENMGLATWQANICKSGLTPEQFLALCRNVVGHMS